MSKHDATGDVATHTNSGEFTIRLAPTSDGWSPYPPNASNKTNPTITWSGVSQVGYYKLVDGKPVSISHSEHSGRNKAEDILEQTDVGGILISSVFLSCPMIRDDSENPLYFETTLYFTGKRGKRVGPLENFNYETKTLDPHVILANKRLFSTYKEVVDYHREAVDVIERDMTEQFKQLGIDREVKGKNIFIPINSIDNADSVEVTFGKPSSVLGSISGYSISSSTD